MGYNDSIWICYSYILQFYFKVILSCYSGNRNWLSHISSLRIFWSTFKRNSTSRNLRHYVRTWWTQRMLRFKNSILLDRIESSREFFQFNLFWELFACPLNTDIQIASKFFFILYSVSILFIYIWTTCKLIRHVLIFNETFFKVNK